MRIPISIALFLLLVAAVWAQTPSSQIPAPADVAAPPAAAAKTASGLATQVVKPGTGKVHPSKEDMVTIDYTGWTTDGKMFDSSVARGTPATFPVSRVIPGFSEGIQMMVARRNPPHVDSSRRSPTKASKGNRRGRWLRRHPH